ncbi:MAG: glycosyltransferase family 39 protein [bacterium]
MIFFSGIIITSCLIAGWNCIGSLFYRGDNESNLKRGIVRTVLGLGVFSYLIFFVGLFSTRIPFFVFLILIVIAAAIYNLLIRKKPLSLPNLSLNELTSFEKLLLLGLSIISIGHFFLAISPNITWDAATHHYLVPKIWLQSGRIAAIPEIIFAEYPSTIELLYMMGLQLAGEWTANVVGWVLSMLLGFAIYAFTSERINKRAGLIASVVFFTMPLTIEVFSGGLIDLGYSLFCLMSFWMYLDYRKSGSRSGLILAGVFAGFSLGSKHLAAEFLVAMIAGIAIYDLFSKKISLKNWIGHLLVFSSVAILVVLQWYIKSYLHTGNPIHPFLPGLFYGWREVKEPISVHAWSRPDYKRSILSLISYPWKLTTDFSFIDFWIMGISPLFLGTIPFWWFYRKKYPGQFFSITILVIVIFMVIAYQIAPSTTRYLIPGLCLISIVTAAALNYLIDDLKKSGKIIVFLFLLVPFIFNTGVIVKRVKDILPVISKKQSKEELYAAKFDGYIAVKWINENLPSDAVVLTSDPKGYFFERKFYVGTPGKQSQVIPPWSEENSNVVLDGWRKLGITHLLFNLSRNVMKNSYFVHTVSKGIEERGELLMTAEQLADLTRIETEYSYRPEEIAEFGTITRTPTKIIDGKVYYHLYKEWWETTVNRDRTQYMLKHYLELRPHLKEVEKFKGAVLYEIDYDL